MPEYLTKMVNQKGETCTLFCSLGFCLTIWPAPEGICPRASLTHYNQVDLLWWDGYDWPNEVDLHGEQMEVYCRKLQPAIVLNDRYVPCKLAGIQDPARATLLRTGEKVSWKRQDDAVVLTLPGEPATDLDEVVEVSW
jgi:hypothetical protein